jgi:GNAT superfamily N-acetyltransferase
MSDLTVRHIDYARDAAALRSFLPERDRMRLEHAEAAVADGDAFICVVAEGDTPVGWAIVHTKYRDDQDWEPDTETMTLQEGDNAYLENIEITARHRSKGLGTKLLQAVEEEARKRGKKALWLHSSENNGLAHRVFEREGWKHETTVAPGWRSGERMRVYTRDLREQQA